MESRACFNNGAGRQSRDAGGRGRQGPGGWSWAASGGALLTLWVVGTSKDFKQGTLSFLWKGPSGSQMDGVRVEVGLLRRSCHGGAMTRVSSKEGQRWMVLRAEDWPNLVNDWMGRVTSEGEGGQGLMQVSAKANQVDGNASQQARERR